MLIGTCAGTEPAIIGEVEQPTRALAGSGHGRPVEVTAEVAIKPTRVRAAWNGVSGENDFVTDQRQKIRRPWRGLVEATVAGNEATAHLGELHQTESLEEVLKRQVFAEWNEMDLIVDREDRAVVADHVYRIVGARDDGIGRRVGRANRASN